MKKILAVILMLVAVGNLSFAADITRERPKYNGHFFDLTNTIPQELGQRLDGYADSLLENLDIDYVIAVVPELEGKTVEGFAAEVFSNWQVGKLTKGQKGVLILIAKKEQKIKIEVGYDLEHIYTDIYVGQTERALLKDFLEQADWERGFFSTMENFFGRAEDMAAKGVDSRDVKGSAQKYWSGGAGVSGVFDLGSALSKPLPQEPQDIREHFGPQPAPGLAFERYMELCGRGITDHTMDIYTDASKRFFSNWPVAAGQYRAEAGHFSNKPYIVYENGKYAVVMIEDINDPDVLRKHNPYFFKKGPKGWQVDIDAMAHSMIMARAFDWYFAGTNHPYMFPFVERYFLKWPCALYPLDGQKAYLGFTYENFDQSKQAWYVKPEFESPALQAGVKPEGGYLISIDGVEITQKYQDWGMMKNYQPEQIVQIEMIQSGIKKTIPVKLMKLKSIKEWKGGAVFKKKPGDPWLGVWFGVALREERPNFDYYWYALEVIPGSPMDKAGLKAGDCFGLQGLDDLLDNGQAKPGDSHQILISRNGKTQEATVVLDQWQPGKEGL
jgi:uncharacterized protein